MFLNQKSVPTVTVSPTYLRITPQDDLKLHGAAAVAPEFCGFFSPEPLIFTWARVRGPPFLIDINSANAQDLYIPGGTLKPGHTYEFELRVSYAEKGTLFGVSKATVEVISPNLQVQILGGRFL